MKCLFSLMALIGVLALPGVVVLGADLPDKEQVMAEEVPAEVIASAVEAVADLGQAVVQGKYQVALDRMNPKWKERYAKRVGGMEELERRLGEVAAQMIKRGITMVSCQPVGAPQAYGVSPESRMVRLGDQQVARLVSSQWLVLVPTVTRFRILQQHPDGGAPQWIQIESTGFQVAVSERDPLAWTFIDGAGLTVNDLRTLFITLPQDLQLPPVEKRETR